MLRMSDICHKAYMKKINMKWIEQMYLLIDKILWNIFGWYPGMIKDTGDNLKSAINVV